MAGQARRYHILPQAGWIRMGRSSNVWQLAEEATAAVGAPLALLCILIPLRRQDRVAAGLGAVLAQATFLFLKSDEGMPSLLAILVGGATYAALMLSWAWGSRVWPTPNNADALKCLTPSRCTSNAKGELPMTADLGIKKCIVLGWWLIGNRPAESILVEDTQISLEHGLYRWPEFWFQHPAGSASLSLSNKLFPVGHPGTPEPSKIISNVPFCDAHEWAMPFHAHARSVDPTRWQLQSRKQKKISQDLMYLRFHSQTLLV